MPEPTLRAVKGMSDLLPPEAVHWEWFESVVRSLMARFGYRNMRTPIVEPTALFVRGLGEATDIVEKEMYSFADSLNGDRLTLRPEATAGIVRAVIEHNLLYNGPQRIWLMGPMFRHERPQKGRSRQFHQLDVEALGFPGPDVDAELILLLRALWQELGLVEGRDLWLELGSLGQPDERALHRQALVAHFEAHVGLLDEPAQLRLQRNPLRLLDSKDPALQGVIEAAPQLMEYLGAASLAHFDAVRAVLDAAGLAYRVNPRLVRGMDYYNLTVFEWVTDRLGAQGTVCGGGRYDGLIAQLGGRPAPGVGFGLGIERLLLLLGEVGVLPQAPVPDVYAVLPDAAALPQVMCVLATLRAAGLSVLMNAGTPGGGGATGGPGSMKAQLKRADASGARLALLFGADELAAGMVAVKCLRSRAGSTDRVAPAGNADSAQTLLPLADAASWAARLRTA